MSARSICVYTLGFPFGSGEAFIEAEVPYLSAAFEEVHFFPLTTQSSRRSLPANCHVHECSAMSRPSLIETLDLLSKAEVKTSFLRSLREQLSLARRHLSRAKELRRSLSVLPPSIHYSYWFDDWATCLSILSRKGHISGYFSRAHGFDLYEARRPLGYFPFRRLQLSEVIKVFPISDQGAAHLISSFGQADKVERAYLGSEDHGMAGGSSTKALSILSCSNVIPLKRVDSIARVVAAIEVAEWTHIGRGSEDDLKALARIAPKSHLVGQQTHELTLALMKESRASVFINLSTTEGLPVTMMEVISMGIPIVATDVGAVREIVTRETGVLIDVESDLETIAEILRNWPKELFSTEERRLRIRTFWEQNFNAALNYPAFMDRLKHLSV